jgi:tetratricopeptide (TPR) repeat protein
LLKNMGMGSVLDKCALATLPASFLVLYWPVLQKLASDWWNDDNYSHGFLSVPPAAYFVWESDAIRLNRTDAAMVRLITPIGGCSRRSGRSPRDGIRAADVPPFVAGSPLLKDEHELRERSGASMTQAQKVFGVTTALVLLIACERDPELAKREYLRNGDTYVSQNKLREATIEYRNAVGVDSRFGEARLKLANTYAELGDAPNAFREYVRAADLMPDNVDAQLKAGHLLLAGRSFEDARARAEKALAKDPTNVEAQILKGNALAGLHDLDGAIAQIEAAIKEDPYRAGSYASLGAVQRAQGNKELAERSFLRAAEAAPSSAPARLALAAFYWSVGRHQEAEKEMNAALAADPRNLMANRFLAAAYLSTGRVAAAEQPLKVIAESVPGIAGRLTLADYYIGAKRTPEAKAILEAIAADHAGFAPARIRQANIAVAEGDRSLAYRLVDEVLRADAQNANALAAKADLQFGDGKSDDALASIRASINAQPSVAVTHHTLGRILASQDQVNEAVAAHQEAIKLNPRFAPALVELARLQLTLQKPDDAMQSARAALAVVPSNGEARLLLARAQLAKQDVQGASETLSGLDRDFPQLSDVQTELGRLYASKKDIARSRAAFEKALTASPTQLGALEGLMALDIAEGKPEAARARLDKAVSGDPRHDSLHILAGRTYFTLRDKAASEAAFKHAVSINPNNLRAYSALGQFYAVENRLGEAAEEYTKVVAKQPRNVSALTMLGMLYDAQRKTEQAAANYTSALRVDPRAAVAANNLAVIHADKNEELDVALGLAQAAKAQLPNIAEVSDTLGWVYYKKGMADLAIPPFRESVDKDPNNPIYHFHLGLAYARAGDKANARKSLERALSLKLPATEAAEANKALATLTS